ncbi:MAG: beta-ketoacyl-ACP synthase II [Candidatus Tectomicrobia bacterium]|nr:beta-ketoacyl-ACP synthase II [Candidatus Tectomicrobia bacterium]
MLQAPRVVITGLGMVTPLGIGKETFWSNLCAGRSGVDRVTHFDTTEYEVKIGAEVKDFDFERYGIEGVRARDIDRAVQLALVAARQALDDARLAFDKPTEEVGAILGCGLSGFESSEKHLKVLFERGPNRVSPRSITMIMPNAAVGYISILNGLMGPSWNVSSACSSSNHSIIDAYNAIRLGDARAMLTGGTEAVLRPLTYAGFGNMKAMAKRYNDDPTRASRPFDAAREGFVMGEGAGMLVLEDLGYARARGARIYAEVVGYGSSSDAYNIVAPDETGRGAALALRRAVAMAGLDPAAIAPSTYVNAHGTSTPFNDKSETLALKEVFGAAAYQLKVSSTKSMLGHLLGAAGAVESITCALALAHQIAPPTINYEHPDPDCDLDYVPNTARPCTLTHALNNSFGFGGHNAVLAFAAYPAA